MKKLNIEFNDKTNMIRLLAGAALIITGFILNNLLNDNFLSFIFFLCAYILLGFDIILKALKNIIKGRVFDENFLMSIATTGALIIGEAPEAAGVMLFYQTGEYFQEKAVEKSKKSITDLMDIRPDYANVFRNGEVIRAAPESVAAGEIIIVKPGEKIPLDGIVIEGTSMIDASALTGESVPRKAKEKDAVLSGCVNINGLIKIEVTKVFTESTVSKIISLVENSADKKAQTENFITKFARIYTPIVVIIAALLVLIPFLLFGEGLKDWLYRALVFLVISCPCALVLSIPMGFFAGIGKAAKNGILIKGGNYLEAFSRLDTVIFDKTGTLTKGVFKVTDVQSAGSFSKDAVLELAAFAECFSNHPIALSVMNEFASGKEIQKENLSEYTELAGFGISVKLNGKIILAGNNILMEKNGILFEESNRNGTKVYVSYDGVFAGCITISDEIKPDSRAAIASLKERGVKKTVMLSGDNPLIAKAIADDLLLDEAYGGLLPHEKVQITEKIKAQLKTGKLAFAGDGINDAPSLAIADIGIAMGALGSDAAIEAADVVLMTDEPSKLAKAIDISRFTGKIVRQNIVFTLCVKVVFLALGAAGVATMWEAVFADVGVSLLAVLNAMRILRMR